jgi:hypothetical protein
MVQNSKTFTSLFSTFSTFLFQFEAFFFKLKDLGMVEQIPLQILKWMG